MGDAPGAEGRPSEVAGPASPPLLDLTVGEVLRATCGRVPEREAAVFAGPGVRWTYRELARRVDALATGLLDLGLEPGDRVGIWAPNRPEWLPVQFATARAGLVLVTVNPACRADELRHALVSVDCRALVLADRFRTSDYLAMLRGVAPEIGGCPPGRLEAAAVPGLRAAVHMGGAEEAGMLRFADVAAARPDPPRLDALARGLGPDDAVNIQFTSGTTGAPKGATLSHRNIVNNAWLVADALGAGEGDRSAFRCPSTTASGW